MSNWDWSWKPDKETRDVLVKSKLSRYERTQRNKARRKALKSQRRKERKKSKPKTRFQKLCAMPGKQFYWTPEWRALRRKVLDHYGYRCMLCGSIDEMHVDHIRPRSREPKLSLTFDNLQVLCKDCNLEKSNIHAEDYREKAASEDLDISCLASLKQRGL